MRDITNQKFAYLIIAHNEPYILNRLISLLDDVRNDIFILIDKKSDKKQFQHIKANCSKITWCDPISIHWGDISLIKAEISLFEKAYNTGRYAYYHLISGVDLPIKTQNYIHSFFSKKENNGKEFIRYSDYPSMKDEINRKTQYYHLFTKVARLKNRYLKSFIYLIDKAAIKFQKVFKIKRAYPFVLKKGSNWCSLTEKTVGQLIQNKKSILKQFKYSLCGDEIFLHSFIWNNCNHDYITNDNLRLIDWERGRPYTFNINDLNEIEASSNLFVRKLSTTSTEQKELVDAIYGSITAQSDVPVNNVGKHPTTN